MAEQPQTPPPGSPASSSGKLSLRERLAQTRKPFNDAVSAFKATPTRVESPSGRGSPVLSSQASFPGTPTPAPADSSQAAAVAIGSDVSPSIKPTQAPGNMPPPQSTQSTPLFTAQNTLQSIPDAQPRPLLPFSQPLSHVTLASQLHNSFAAFPESDHEFSPSQAVISQINAYELPTRPKFSKGEYALVLALSDGQKKAYLQNINNKAKIIQRFCEGEQNDNETTSIIRNVLSTAACVSTHLDLTSNDSIDWEQTEVGYALLHPKFQFLKTFLDSLRQQNMLVAICAQPGKTLDLLELFLRGIKVRCRRTDGFSSRPPLAFDEVNGLVSVALLATGPDNSRVVGNYASIVIAFDSTFDINEKHVVNYRTHTLEVGRLSPVLRLISINTVEHVKLYISPRNNANYLNQLMSFVAILRDQAGVLPSSITGNATTDALDMAKSIIRMSEAGGETLQLPEIPALPLYEPASQTSSQQTSVLASQASEAPVARTQPVKPVAVDSQPIQHAGEKRRWQEVLFPNCE
ncbi:hypothetical protein DFH27DRAFT_86565 [Peziza echinospora]|nr:hypothetical protein DFH27DRAFT_86565 [Peziza echinospora]